MVDMDPLSKSMKASKSCSSVKKRFRFLWACLSSVPNVVVQSTHPSTPAQCHDLGASADLCSTYYFQLSCVFPFRLTDPRSGSA